MAISGFHVGFWVNVHVPSVWPGEPGSTKCALWALGKKRRGSVLQLDATCKADFHSCGEMNGSNTS